MSVKLKITLWYSFFMIVVLCVSGGLLIQYSASRIFSSVDNQLKHTVTRSFNEVSFRNGILNFDTDFHVLGLEKGVYLSAYDSSGNYIYGDLPSYYDGAVYLSMDVIQEEYDFYTDWKIYDYQMDIEGYGPLWIRGITSQTQKEGWMISMVRTTIFILPFLALAVSLGGYHIIRRTLLPLDILNRISSEISTGDDLSKRTGLPQKNDEVHRLASTFDHMMNRLEQAFDREKQFTSDVSHELRTPISAILAQCEYALLEDATLQDCKEALDAISRQGKKMSSLISQLLFLARADHKTQLLKKESFCLSELVTMVADSLEGSAAQKNISIHLSLPPTLNVTADETMMIRFFSNMITNAIKYGKENGNIWLQLEQEGSLIRGSIKDDGIGISQENLPKIWDRFFQADSSRTTSEDGSCGLGLSLCKWIIEAHNGKINVESTLSLGTVFTFYIEQKR